MLEDQVQSRSLFRVDKASISYRLLPLTVIAALAIGCAGEDGGSSSSSTASSNSSSEKSKPEPVEEPAEEATAVAEPEETSEPAATAETKAAPPKKEAAAKKVVDPNATGSFSGKIVLDGDAPTLDPLAKADDENLKDKEVCGMGDVPDESLVVGDNNGIANVFVYLRRAPKGFKSEPPSDPVVLDQKACVFTPHVALIQAGQKVLVKSSDPIQHNVHTFPGRNQGANILIKPNDQEGIELDYSRAESEPIQVKCDIHAWMASYHLILDHPFMAVSDANGEFKIDGLPAGEYEFRVWHERGGLLERGYEFTVTGEDDPVELKYGVDKFPG